MNQAVFPKKGEVIDMPARDGTGPLGYGPRTGWGLGPCGRGFGFRRGFGRGFGFRRFWGPAPAWGYGPGYVPFEPTKDQEIADLRAEREAIQQELRDIEARLKELESKK